MGLIRAEVIQRMRGAFRAKQSASSFIRDMKAKGLSYRHTTMLADWRSINELETKEGLLQYVRKDYTPGKQAIAQVSWDISAEYMYVCVVKSQVAPGEPILETKVNIMQDYPISPREVEALAWAMIQEQSPKEIEKIVSVTPWAAVQRVLE